MTTRLPVYLDGPERLERWPAARRVVRMGSPDALAVSDLERTLEHARAGRRAEALAYVEMMHPSHLMMIEVTYEWCLRTHAVLGERRSADDAARALADAESEWRALGALPPARPPLPALEERLSAAWLAQQLTATLKQKRGKMLNIPSPALTAELETLRARVAASAAVDDIERYYAHARAMHDALIEHLWASATAIARLGGDALVDEVVTGAFHSVPAVNMMWPALHMFSASDAALFLAEHLRGHFSGEGRRGAVTIIDEPDRYRLVFDPCGSGGAVRRKVAGGDGDADGDGAGVGREARPTSWGQTGVPFYCMHCAHNELRSIEAIGFPRWVTEYDPDPAKPCGWTIYKNPIDIPERYFTRLGLKRDPARFKKTGGALGKVKALVGAIGILLRAR